MEIFKEFVFDAAHYNPEVPCDHRCHSIHGHTYHVTIFLTGRTDSQTGWVNDFGDIKTVMVPILELLDHGCLNEIEGLNQPTCENIAKWIWQKAFTKLPLLSKVMVRQSTSSGVIYAGDEA